MVCLSYCLLGSGFLFGSIACMATSKNAGNHADFQKLLIFDTLTEKAETIDLRYV